VTIRISQPGEILTVQEVAQFLKLSPTTVRQLCHSGRLPWLPISSKKGSAMRVEVSDLREFVARAKGGAA